MANKRDSLGDRMKNNYENRAKTYLVRRMPVIIRLDGKAFHTFTRGFDKPFDKVMMKAMQQTTLRLCENIQGCVFGYTQSDEITLILIDYETLDTNAWFDYSTQKMCSVAASMCTLYFSQEFEKAYSEWFLGSFANVEVDENAHKLNSVYEKAINKGAMFDARVFNIPREELINCVLWRIKDSVRNSISSLAQSKFSHKELQGKNSSQMQDMLMETFSINWNNLSNFEKTGTLIVKDEDIFKIQDVMIKSYTDLEKFLVEKNIFF
jgi:tRNA(His) 5'-end guanylyltransferase